MGEAQDSYKRETGKCYYYVLSVSRSGKIKAMHSWNSDRQVPVGRSTKGQPGSLLLTFQLPGLKWGGARLLPRPVLVTTYRKRIFFCLPERRYYLQEDRIYLAVIKLMYRQSIVNNDE